MSIVSINYYVFLVISAIFYYIIPKAQRFNVLLVASVYFYLQICTLKLSALTFAMILVAYISGLLLEKYHKKASELSGKSGELDKKIKCIVTSAVCFEALILIVLQDNEFFIVATNGAIKLFGGNFAIPLPNFLAPLGISYFTLMLISYILDVHWQISKAERNLGKLTVYTIFFPQIISGPLTRYKDINENLLSGNDFNHKNIELGIQKILWGLFKKLVVAERIATIVNTIVDNYTAYSGSFIMIAVVGYALQLYADFSASMDIVLGSAQILGIKLPENFSNPFFSQSLTVWWRNWHITLGAWVKDYILYPVLKSKTLQNINKKTKQKFGKKASKSITIYIGLFVTWVTVGAWHGGSWSYIIGTGFNFFALISLGMLLKPITEKFICKFNINTECFSFKLFCSLRTFLLFSTSIFMGRIGSVSTYLKMMKQVLVNFQVTRLFNVEAFEQLGLDLLDLNILFLALLVMVVIEILQTKFEIREKISEQNIIFRWILWFVLIFATIIFGFYGPGYDPADFIYGGF